MRLVGLLLVGACAHGAGEDAAFSAGATEGIELERSLAWCFGSAVDADADGLEDGCELALARAFAPLLVVDTATCAWDRSVTPGRLGGEYLFAAAPAPAMTAPAGTAPASAVRLAYLPAYYRDCGWRGPQCRLTPGLCEGHVGDSELIVVDVTPVPGVRQASGGGGDRARWRTAGVFLSAHCFGRSDGRCRWYRGPELRALAWADALGGAPVVWVARGTHGNYPSRHACDAGHWGYDTCDGNALAYRFPVRSDRQNVGSGAAPFLGRSPGGCIGGDFVGWGSALPRRGAVECPWREAVPFRGWQDEGAGVTPYARYLESMGFR